MNLNIASFRIMNMNIVIMYIAPFVATIFGRYSIVYDLWRTIPGVDNDVTY